MAGKTFPGIGDMEDESPPLDPADAADSSGDAQFYSGPTVVDEAKVEQGLKKLRSLDAPPGPLTGIHRAVADALDDPRLTPQVTIPGTLMMPEYMIDPARGTAVGRSVSGPVAGQQVIPSFEDRGLRGTMFGHTVHLPDLELRARSEEVETSKALAVVERGVQTSHEIAIFQPGASYAQQAGIPRGVDPYPRSNRFHMRDTPIDLRVSSRRKLGTRVGLAAAGIAAIVLAALLWVRSNSQEAESGPRPTAAFSTPRPPGPSELPPPRPAVAPLPAPEVKPAAAAAAAPRATTPADDHARPVAAAPSPQGRAPTVERAPERGLGSAHPPRPPGRRARRPATLGRGQAGGQGRRPGRGPGALQASQGEASDRGRSRRHHGADHRMIARA